MCLIALRGKSVLSMWQYKLEMDQCAGQGGTRDDLCLEGGRSSGAAPAGA